jgi:hypothetical protein
MYVIKNYRLRKVKINKKSAWQVYQYSIYYNHRLNIGGVIWIKE